MNDNRTITTATRPSGIAASLPRHCVDTHVSHVGAVRSQGRVALDAVLVRDRYQTKAGTGLCVESPIGDSMWSGTSTGARRFATAPISTLRAWRPPID